MDCNDDTTIFLGLKAKISILSVHVQMVFKFLPFLLQEKSIYIIQFLLASLKTHTKNCSEIRPCMYSGENLSMRAKERQNRKLFMLLEQFRNAGGFRNNFYSHRRLSKSRNKLSEGRIFTISEWLHRKAETLNWFSSQKESQKFENFQLIQKVGTVLIWGPSKNIHLVTL